MIRSDIEPVTEEFLGSLPDDVLEALEVHLCFAGGWRANPYRLQRRDGKIHALSVKASRWLQLDHIGSTRNDTRIFLENPETNLPLTMEELFQEKIGTVLWVKYAGWGKSFPYKLAIITDTIPKVAIFKPKQGDLIELSVIGDKRGDIQVFREEYQWKSR
jgi:hypothetical protein